MSQDKGLQRQKWAVECMAIKPGDQVLEIGCGTGSAVPWVCEKLKSGHLLAIDASSTMIQKAIMKNRKPMESGQVLFRAVALSDLEWNGELFHKALAFNVNVFWLKPGKELERLRELLRPRALAFFFYTPPDLDQLNKIKSRLPEVLGAHGFKVQDSFEAKFDSTRAYGVKAVPMRTKT
ncbi:MAG TPA: class I SAM-dependent methyltransferase [Oligoflexus sp.]|uniref:class I SAM-dependent methyltransferase n=1 Tax=Oligoflexus sp. TaxID=1971216 RepID=UPI002D7F25A4|nr:class I SAM-dependent methyltransferase [Oligoflexus sp.]HET9236366.1 class I SAM-dependent methyltransferase [Oligoflexus sp.]